MKKIVAVFVLFFAWLTSNAQISIDTAVYFKNNPGIYSLIIAKNDKVLYQKYYNGHAANNLMNDQSLTKSICAILIGLAIDKHYIRSPEQKLSDFFPELKADRDMRKQDITIRHLMNQSSGMYHEDLNKLAEWLSVANPSAYVLKAPLSSDPGRVFHYSNAASHLMSVLISRATRMDARTFATKFLFTPLGITQFEWAKMRDGYYDASGLLSIRMRALDMLKIGTLILNNGDYQYKQIVSAKWATKILTPELDYDTQWGFDKSTYALCWYHVNYKGTPITYGMGWGGQFMIVIPSLKAVIMANQSIDDATAVKREAAFTHHLFPIIFDQLKGGK